MPPILYFLLKIFFYFLSYFFFDFCSCFDFFCWPLLDLSFLPLNRRYYTDNRPHENYTKLYYRIMLPERGEKWNGEIRG